VVRITAKDWIEKTGGKIDPEVETLARIEAVGDITAYPMVSYIITIGCGSITAAIGPDLPPQLKGPGDKEHG